MSTYTDLHNRVKENITVDYNNRITPQRVRLFNEQNEYWGTFRGHVSAENINIEGGNLVGVTLNDTIIKGSVILPDGIDLVKVMKSVQDLSTQIDKTDKKIDQERTDRATAVSTEETNRIQADTALYGNIDSEQTARREEDTILSNAIKTERIVRFNEDSKLSDAIVDLRADLGGEVFDRKIADGKLELSLANEINRSTSRDNFIDSELALHIEDNNEQFSILCANMLSTIEHDRHYIINDGSFEKNTDCWPYNCKDYAVNIYNPSSKDGDVYYVDKYGKRYEIGQIVKNTKDSLYPFKLKTYKNIGHDGITSALLTNWPYDFTSTAKACETGLNGYSIQFDDTDTTGQLSNFKFNLVPNLTECHKMHSISGMVGKIYDAYPSGECADIISGKMWFDTNNAELEVFNKFRSISFNNSDMSVITKQTERITYLSLNKLKLEKNIDSRKYINLPDILDPDKKNFGYIFEKNGGKDGIISNDVDGIVEINVTLETPYNDIFTLSKDKGFKCIVKENEIDDNISYNVILSANVINTDGKFDEVKVSEQYKYNFYGIDSTGALTLAGYVLPKQYNTTIKQSADFKYADVNLVDIMWIEDFKKVYTLTKTADGKLWSVEDIDNDHNVLNVKFTGSELYVKVTSGDDGAIIHQQYVVDIDTPILYNVDTCYLHIHKTEFISLATYNNIDPKAEAEYTITIEDRISFDDYNRYELNIDTSSIDILKILMPERTTTDISREFITTIKPNSVEDKQLELQFVNNDGIICKVVYNRGNKIFIPSNTWTTLQIKEIDHNIFYVKDYDGNNSLYDVEFLSNAIDKEITNRIENDNLLCNEIQLSVGNLQDQVISVNYNIADIYEKIKGGINYKGVVYGEVKDPIGTIHKVNTISNLFVWPECSYVCRPDYTINTVLSNGYMYVMQQQEGSTTTKFNIEGIDIEVRDYIIINCNKDGSGCNGKTIKDLVATDIDIIDAEDNDVVHSPELSAVSVFLSANIDALSTSLSNTIQLSVSDLQNLIISNDNDIEFLSNAISGTEESKISGFTFLSSNIDYISTEVSCNDKDIQYLSNTVDFLLSVDKETMNYKGTLPYLPNLSNDITHEDLGYNYMSTFVIQNMGIHAPNRLKLGDFFRLSAVQSCLYDANHKACWFGAKDYFVFNKDCIVQDIVESDFDVFRNAESEFEWLSAALCADIVELSTSLSNTTKISVEVLQDKISENTGRIAYVSSEVSCNDNDINFLSNEVSCNSNNIAYVSSEVSCNDNDINFLSNDLSTLKYDHYNKNLSTDIELVHIVPGQTFLSVVDQLLITDEITFDTYRLTIRNGSLNINLVKKFEK